MDLPVKQWLGRFDSDTGSQHCEISSVVVASALHAGCREFDPLISHHISPIIDHCFALVGVGTKIGLVS